jgi:hypothetical protein
MTFVHPWVLGRRWLRVVLGVFDTVPLLLMAVAVVVLAGPQMLKVPRSERSLTNIQIAMDVSGSMGGPRYRLASQAIEEFTKAREGDAFGLTLFGSHQIRWIPLTKDLRAVRNAMPFANPENQPLHMSGTSIGAALRFCRDNMEREAPEGDRLIILVSDGFSSDLGAGQEFEIAEELKDAGITVYHIHVAEDAIPAEVVEIARLTGGEAMAASDASTLKTVFTHIDRMKPAKFIARGAVPLDHFHPFAFAALVLAGLHLAGLLGMRYTPW